MENFETISFNPKIVKLERENIFQPLENNFSIKPRKHVEAEIVLQFQKLIF